MADGKFIAYYRVSTARQGRSGLGLEAQQTAVRDYLNGGAWSLEAEFTEIESGKSDKNRPQLAAALAACRQQKATLVIAKLDRLSRNAAFLLTLRDSGVEIRACDMPQASTLEFGIRAVIAQHDREMIAERTKAALQAAKARGVELGKNGKRLARRHQSEALARASAMADMLVDLRRSHPTTRGLASALNQQGVPTPKGGVWHPSTVHRLLRRLDNSVTAAV